MTIDTTPSLAPLSTLTDEDLDRLEEELEVLGEWEFFYGHLQPDCDPRFRARAIELEKRGELRLCPWALKSGRRCPDGYRKGHGRRGRK